jgi:hypothetical protein
VGKQHEPDGSRREDEVAFKARAPGWNADAALQVDSLLFGSHDHLPLARHPFAAGTATTLMGKSWNNFS